MKTVEVRFKKLSSTATIPQYTRQADACLDLTSDVDITISHEATLMVSTGIAMEIPSGYEGRVRGRSGLSSKGIHAHHGTIDEEYRGEVKVIVTNNSGQAYTIRKGDRIAQFSVSPVYKIMILEAKELSDTERGSNGFGSSDKVNNGL